MLIGILAHSLRLLLPRKAGPGALKLCQMTGDPMTRSDLSQLRPFLPADISGTDDPNALPLTTGKAMGITGKKLWIQLHVTSTSPRRGASRTG